MRKAGVLDAMDRLAKIQVLAAAAAYLTASEKEEQLCFELIDVIEELARLGAEVESD